MCSSGTCIMECGAKGGLRKWMKLEGPTLEEYLNIINDDNKWMEYGLLPSSTSAYNKESLTQHLEGYLQYLRLYL